MPNGTSSKDTSQIARPNLTWKQAQMVGMRPVSQGNPYSRSRCSEEVTTGAQNDRGGEERWTLNGRKSSKRHCMGLGAPQLTGMQCVTMCSETKGVCSITYEYYAVWSTLSRARERLILRERIKYKDIYREFVDQMASRLSPSLWIALPPELIDNIVARNLPSSMDRNPRLEQKAAVTSAVLTCKRWTARYRPLLFHHIALSKPSDLYYLRTILASATSGWLRTHIHSITLCSSDPSAGQELLRSLPVLTGQLCNLLEVTYSCEDPGGRSWFPATLRTSWGGTCSSVKNIRLQKCRFHSASTLLRALGALPVLETVSLEDVYWTGDSSLDARFACRSSFAFIRNLDSHKCQEHWPLAWIFAAASVGHRLEFRSRDEPAIVPSSVTAIVGLLKLLAPTPEQRMLFNKQEATRDGRYFTHPSYRMF